MDNIEVEDAQHGDLISFKTNIGSLGNGHGDHKHKDKDKDNLSFSIDYIIHMPAGNPLKLTNSFGKIMVPDLKGTVELISKFGGLTAGNLENVDAIDVEFGEAKIGDVANGKLTLKFDKGRYREIERQHEAQYRILGRRAVQGGRRYQRVVRIRILFQYPDVRLEGPFRRI